MKGTSISRSTRILIALPALLMVVVPALLMAGEVSAAYLSNRSVTIGTSIPDATTTHGFRFTIATAGLLGSIELEYCSNDPFPGTPCVAPAGLSLSSAVLNGQSGEVGFTVDGASTANKLILTRPATPAIAQAATYNFSGVINPSAANTSTYVRISTFASSDASDPRTDTGGVIFSTSSGLGTLAYVPPYLTFCVGITVSANCSASGGSGINFGELSTSEPRFASSQFAGSTNDPTGYSASILGTTMTSGNNVIPASGSPVTSRAGTSQFGLNLRANTSPPIGQNPFGSGTATVQPSYNQANQFMFLPGSKLVSSPLPSNFNTFTVSYVVNVSSSQPPGVYSTTATFLATAAF